MKRKTRFCISWKATDSERVITDKFHTVEMRDSYARLLDNPHLYVIIATWQE